jgi:antitoxin ParD1/3/4
METRNVSLTEAMKIAKLQTLVTEGMESGAGKRTMEELREAARKKASSR